MMNKITEEEATEWRDAYHAGKLSADEMMAYESLVKSGALYDPAFTKDVDPQELTWIEATRQGIRNFPESLYEQASMIIEGLLHPIESIESLGKVAIGAMQPSAEEAAASGEEGPILSYEPEAAQAWEGMKEFYGERYGDTEAIKETIATDPAGVLMDVSSALTGAGNVLPKVGTVGKAINPFNIMKTAAKAGTVGALDVAAPGIARRFYQSAVPVPKSMPIKERNLRLDFGIKHSITPNQFGLWKLEDILEDLNTRADNIIADAVASGRGTVSWRTLVNSFDDAAKEFDHFMNNERFLKTIENEKIGFLKQYGGSVQTMPSGQQIITLPANIPIDEAQKLKRGVGKQLRKTFEAERARGATPSIQAQQVAQKRVYRALRTEIERLVPEIKGVNQQFYDALGLQEIIEQRAVQLAGSQLINLHTAGATVTGGMLAGSRQGAQIALVAKNIIDSPVIKAKLAAWIRNSRRPTTSGAPTMGMARLGSIATQQAMEEE